MENKKILIVGDWAYDIYEKAFYEAFSELGFDVGKFAYGEYFKYANHPSLADKNLSILRKGYYKAQYKYSCGPTIKYFNNLLIKQSQGYDIIFLYTCRHIYGQTIKTIKKNNPNICICAYNNDNPFSLSYPKYVWRNYFKTLKYVDKIYSFRLNNILDYNNIGYQADLLRAYYREKYNFRLDSLTKYDVIFIGHFENDGRDEYIKGIIDSGVNVQIFGTGWENSPFYNLFTNKMGKIVPQYGNNYNRCLNESKIALVFLSKKNIDTYTRRNFEIPATGVFMLSEYSDDLSQNLFVESVECDYFRSIEECVSKINYYLQHDDERVKIAHNGYTKNQKNEVKERVKQLINGLLN